MEFDLKQSRIGTVSAMVWRPTRIQHAYILHTNKQRFRRTRRRVTALRNRRARRRHSSGRDAWQQALGTTKRLHFRVLRLYNEGFR